MFLYATQNPLEVMFLEVRRREPANIAVDRAIRDHMEAVDNVFELEFTTAPHVFREDGELPFEDSLQMFVIEELEFVDSDRIVTDTLPLPWPDFFARRRRSVNP